MHSQGNGDALMYAGVRGSSSWPTKLVSGLSRRFRSQTSYSQQATREKNSREEADRQDRRIRHGEKHGYEIRSLGQGYASQSQLDETGERKAWPFNQEPGVGDKYKDHTDMLHLLADSNALDYDCSEYHGHEAYNGSRHGQIPGKHHELMSLLSSVLWQHIADWLSPVDAARLTLVSHMFQRKLGNIYLETLNTDEHRASKIAFLRDMDCKLPRHLFCFVCATYHLRSKPGSEKLMANFNTNPLFNCPRVKETILPRARISHGRELPYAFVQLVLRHKHFSPAHGIPVESLSRRWGSDTAWKHQTRFIVHEGRLLMRVVSHIFAPPGVDMTISSERHLLYDREEYLPYFSVCPHWRDGHLMKVCKCALSHIPEPPQSQWQQLRKGPRVHKHLIQPNFIVTGCTFCRPARRCPECPSEYLVEVRMLEDPSNAAFPFRHALVVSRWCDLGDGQGPDTSREWVAATGPPNVDSQPAYESFTNVGRRAVAGIFESDISGITPGQRMLSLNPRAKKEGEDGDDWY